MKKKSKIYHIRFNTVGLNAERTAEVLGVSIDDVRRFDTEGAPVMAERLLLLWDRKYIGLEGWDGWLFSRGVLRHGKHQWTAKMILEHQEHSKEVFKIRDELRTLRAWKGLCTIFVDKVVEEMKQCRRFRRF
jgi:hypothetical protein